MVYGNRANVLHVLTSQAMWTCHVESREMTQPKKKGKNEWARPLCMEVWIMMTVFMATDGLGFDFDGIDETSLVQFLEINISTVPLK